jgi:hypothetical protein
MRQKQFQFFIGGSVPASRLKRLIPHEEFRGLGPCGCLVKTDRSVPELAELLAKHVAAEASVLIVSLDNRSRVKRWWRFGSATCAWLNGD